MIHIVLILLGRMIVDEIPGISNAIKWTIVNLCYMTVRTHAAARRWG